MFKYCLLGLLNQNPKTILTPADWYPLSSVKNSTYECPEPVFISGLALHWSRGLHISHPPGHSTPDSCPIFTWDWDLYLQRSTPSVPLWSPPDTFPWDNVHWTEDIILAMSGLEIGQGTTSGIATTSCIWTVASPPPSHAAVFPELSALTPGKPSRYDDFGFVDTGVWIGLTALAFWLCVRQKTGFVLEFHGDLFWFPRLETSYFFVFSLTGRCYVCAQSHRTALDEACTSSCQ